MLTIYGVPFSAHTRKVILTARWKDLPFAVEPVVPLTPPPAWEDLSPTGKIPAIKDGDFALADSSAICAYLEKKHPAKPIFPQTAEDLGRALWLEEYVDGTLQEFVLSHFLLETIFAPAFLQKDTNWEKVNNALKVEIPQCFHQLEQWIKVEQYLVANQFSIADITLASILINFAYGGKAIDESAFPRLAAYFKFILRHPTVRETLAAENAVAKSIPGFNFNFLQSVL